MTTFLFLYDFVYLFNSEATLITNQVILSYVQHVEKYVVNHDFIYIV